MAQVRVPATLAGAGAMTGAGALTGATELTPRRHSRLESLPLLRPSRAQRVGRTLRAKAEENVGHYLDVQRRCRSPKGVPMEIHN